MHPTYLMAAAQQVIGRSRDLYLVHYMHGHNLGGNLCSSVRPVVYFRFRNDTHIDRWRERVRDELLEFALVQQLLPE
jgi:hypothetical protein